MQLFINRLGQHTLSINFLASWVTNHVEKQTMVFLCCIVKIAGHNYYEKQNTVIYWIKDNGLNFNGHCLTCIYDDTCPRLLSQENPSSRPLKHLLGVGKTAQACACSWMQCWLQNFLKTWQHTVLCKSLISFIVSKL